MPTCRDFNHNQLCKTKGFRPESFIILMVLCHEKQLALLLNLYSQRSDRKENIDEILKNQYQYHKILQSCILFIEVTWINKANLGIVFSNCAQIFSSLQTLCLLLIPQWVFCNLLNELFSVLFIPSSCDSFLKYSGYNSHMITFCLICSHCNFCKFALVLWKMI